MAPQSTAGLLNFGTVDIGTDHFIAGLCSVLKDV